MPIKPHEFDLDVVEDMKDWMDIENDPSKKVHARIPFVYKDWVKKRNEKGVLEEKDSYILKVVVLVDE